VSPSQWNYVPSADNTDDDACRGLHPTDFTIHHIWFAGPKFLKGAKDWPRLLLLTLIGENNQEICELTWVGLMQTERDSIDKLIDNKSLIYIIINSIVNVFRFSLNARILHERLHKRKIGGLLGDEID
jgi:hypothetical protein